MALLNFGAVEHPVSIDERPSSWPAYLEVMYRFWYWIMKIVTSPVVVQRSKLLRELRKRLQERVWGILEYFEVEEAVPVVLSMVIVQSPLLET